LLNGGQQLSHIMKKTIILALAALFTSSSYALTWNFTTETVDTPPLKFLYGATNNSNSVYTSTTGANGTQFNLLGAGYNPATMIVTSATVTFWFADDESDGAENVDIFVNGTNITGTKIFSNLEVNGAHPAPNYAPYSANLGDFAGLIAGLQDGIMEYQVRLLNGSNYGSNGGDTYLKIASISATGTYRNVNNNVPDAGSSIALLGGALAALGLLRRRFLR